MYGRKVKLRFLFVVIILLTLILSVFLVLKSLEENVVYFQSPSEIYTSSEFTLIEFFLTIPPTLILFVSNSDNVLISVGD